MEESLETKVAEAYKHGSSGVLRIKGDHGEYRFTEIREYNTEGGILSVTIETADGEDLLSFDGTVIEDIVIDR